MKVINYLPFFSLTLNMLLFSCSNSSDNSTDSENDTVIIKNIDTAYKKSIDVSQLTLDTNLIKAQVSVANRQISIVKNLKNDRFKKIALENLSVQLASLANILDTSTSIALTCVDPSSIRDLKDGISLQAYDFKKGDEYKLGLMGFANIEIQDDSKITVVEFAQSGSTKCDDKILPYGIGARLMLQIIKKKRNAKLATPQQITASVIYNRAEVKYSVKTFGITGPKTASLIRSGTLSENTYEDFINAIADIIVEAYKNNSDYIIAPQYMPLKQ